MPRTRTTKKLAQRIDMNYFLGPHPLRRWRFWLSVALPALAVLWLLWHLAGHDARVYSSGACRPRTQCSRRAAKPVTFAKRTDSAHAQVTLRASRATTDPFITPAQPLSHRAPLATSSIAARFAWRQPPMQAAHSVMPICTRAAGLSALYPPSQDSHRAIRSSRFCEQGSAIRPPSR